MTARRLAALLIAAAGLASGCTTWNDRFYVPGQDPVLTFMRGEYVSQGDWPAAQLPYLRPMRTEFIPDRRGPAPDPIPAAWWAFPAPYNAPPSAWPPL
jgi:hypothetical protein